jgi:flagellar capping protein FliD
MEQAKVNWNDDRLDHFAAQVDKRFEEVDRRFDKFEAHVDARFNRLEMRFDSLMQAMIITLASILAAFAALAAATAF